MVLCAHIVKMILNTKQKKYILLLSGSTFAGKHHDGSARLLGCLCTVVPSFRASIRHQHVTFPELWTNYIWYWSRFFSLMVSYFCVRFWSNYYPMDKITILGMSIHAQLSDDLISGADSSTSSVRAPLFTINLRYFRFIIYQSITFLTEHAKFHKFSLSSS